MLIRNSLPFSSQLCLDIAKIIAHDDKEDTYLKRLPLHQVSVDRKKAENRKQKIGISKEK